MVADQVRGARNTKRETGMMERMFGSVATGAEQSARTDAPSRDPGAVEHLNWIEGLIKANESEASIHDLTAGEEHDLNRVRLDVERASMTQRFVCWTGPIVLFDLDVARWIVEQRLQGELDDIFCENSIVMGGDYGAAIREPRGLLCGDCGYSQKQHG